MLPTVTVGSKCLWGKFVILLTAVMPFGVFVKIF